jgi:hypothetical protein
MEVMHALGRLSLSAPVIKKALEEGLRDEKQYVRESARASLERLRKLAED